MGSSMFCGSVRGGPCHFLSFPHAPSARAPWAPLPSAGCFGEEFFAECEPPPYRTHMGNKNLGRTLSLHAASVCLQSRIASFLSSTEEKQKTFRVDLVSNKNNSSVENVRTTLKKKKICENGYLTVESKQHPPWFPRSEQFPSHD